MRRWERQAFRSVPNVRTDPSFKRREMNQLPKSKCPGRGSWLHRRDWSCMSNIQRGIPQVPKSSARHGRGSRIRLKSVVRLPRIIHVPMAVAKQPWLLRLVQADVSKVLIGQCHREPVKF